MNSQQRKYALERIEEIRAAKEADLKAKHTTKAVSLATTQKIELINQGKVKARDLTHFGYAYGAFDFSKFEKPASLSATGKTAITKLNKQAQAIKDTVALGEASKALAAIAEFEK